VLFSDGLTLTDTNEKEIWEKEILNTKDLSYKVIIFLNPKLCPVFSIPVLKLEKLMLLLSAKAELWFRGFWG
jgi:hypothetical protein